MAAAAVRTQEAHDHGVRQAALSGPAAAGTPPDPRASSVSACFHCRSQWLLERGDQTKLVTQPREPHPVTSGSSQESRACGPGQGDPGRCGRGTWAGTSPSPALADSHQETDRHRRPAAQGTPGLAPVLVHAARSGRLRLVRTGWPRTAGKSPLPRRQGDLALFTGRRPRAGHRHPGSRDTPHW